jgi:hypothetical protein
MTDHILGAGLHGGTLCPGILVPRLCLGMPDLGALPPLS